MTDYEDDQNNDLNEFGDEVAEDRENVDFNNLDVEGKNEDSDIEEEFDDWGNEDENEQEDNH